MAHTLPELELRRSELLRQIAALGDFRSGSITSIRGRCGKPNCHCHKPNHPGHGPNFRLTRKRKGKTVSEACSAVGKIGTTFDPKLEFYGDDSTKLVPLP